MSQSYLMPALCHCGHQHMTRVVRLVPGARDWVMTMEIQRECNMDTCPCSGAGGFARLVERVTEPGEWK